MKIVIVDNSSISRKNGHHFTNALNGIFIKELIEIGISLTYLQFESLSTNNISSFDLEDHGVICVSLSQKNSKIWSYLSAYLKAVKIIKASDFVYLYYPNTFKYIAFLCLLLRKPYGLYIRGMNGVNDKLSHYIYKHASTVFTVSDYFTNMVNQVTGKDIAHTIRPMIPYTDVDVVVGRKYVQREEFNILYLGRIAADKGLAELMQASKQLHDKGYKFKLKVVGNGEFSPQLAQMVTDLDLQDFVSLEGPVYDNDKKADYYKKADLYVLPTYHEGFPRTLYEAMIFGTPIITTFVGGIPALMKNKENCLEIKPRSKDSIEDAMAYAMNHYEVMGEMAKNATKLVSTIVDRNRPSHAQQLNQIIQDYGK